ncbi:MAG: hypothetical protein U0M70_02685 [Eubacteriales bacterium]
MAKYGTSLLKNSMGKMEGCWRDVGDIPECENFHGIRMQLNCLTR